MDWYYAVNQEKQGPFDDQTFHSLVADGTVTKNTYVWNKTMTDWTKYGAVIENETPQPVSEPESETALVTEQDNTTLQNCSECGKAFDQEEMVPFNDSWVCAACKPVFLQKIREGVSTEGVVYAGFWIRLVAKFIDGLIMGAVNFVISLVSNAVLLPAMMDPSMGADPEHYKKIMIPAVIATLLQWSLNILYSTWFVGRFGATPGKMACGLKIITAENEKVSYLRALGRFFSEIISTMILFIGYIMAAFDSEKRALHDRICSTRVIKKRS